MAPGRKKGSPNKVPVQKTIAALVGIEDDINPLLRDELTQIRCTKGFKEISATIARHERNSISDVLHRALQYYALNKCTWMSGQDRITAMDKI
jgi:hypothetical protein